MPRRLFLALLLLVAAPIVLLGSLSANATRANQIAAKESLANLLSSQLYDADRRVAQLFDGYATELNAGLRADESPLESLRRLRRDVPIVRQGILVDRTGTVLYPTAADSVGIDAAEVAASIPGMIDARPLPSRQPAERQPNEREPNEREPAESGPTKGAKTIKPTAVAKAKSPSAGKFAVGSEPAPAERARDESAWQQWYMADGAQVVHWTFRPDGMAVGVLLERSRWMADLIAVLPDDVSNAAFTAASPSRGFSKPATSGAGKSLASTPIGSVNLVDEAKRTIYRWGDVQAFEAPELVSANLSEPLASWQFRLHVDPALIPKSDPLTMYLSLGSIALVLLAVGFYVLTSVQRQITEAKSRVSFAGQVSHELRTPLTNIRLYTELAGSDLEGLAESDTVTSLSKRLEVIDHESRRLQRLVSGVLEMIRPSGNRVGVRREPTDVCELIKGLAEQFAPSFSAAGLQVESHCPIDHPLPVDPDVVEIVLVNLLSNIEKYVPCGGHCWIECGLARSDRSQTDELHIVVADDGPGISAMHRAKVFRPFQRIDDSISAPSGTGIGLTIARRAAERHGGDLTLLSKSRFSGAAFRLSIPIEAS